jgi:hypothetical protein
MRLAGEAGVTDTTLFEPHAETASAATMAMTARLTPPILR